MERLKKWFTDQGLGAEDVPKVHHDLCINVDFLRMTSERLHELIEDKS